MKVLIDSGIHDACYSQIASSHMLEIRRFNRDRLAFLEKRSNFVLKIRAMAITIKSIPVLEGGAAEEFIRRAEKNAAKVTPVLSTKSKKRIQAVLEKSKTFKF